MNREVGFRFEDSANQFPSLIYEGRPKCVGKVQRARTKFQSFFRADRSTRSLTSPLTRSQSTHARSSLALSRRHPHSIKYSSSPPLNPLIYLAVQFLGRRASLSFLFISTPEGGRSTNLQPRTLKFRAMYSSSAARSTDDDKWSGFSSPPPATGASLDVDKLLHSDHHSQNTSVVASAPPTYEERDQVQWSSGLCDCLSDRRNCCITCCCPCVTFGQIAEIVDKGSSSCGVNGALYTLIFCTVGCCCCYSCFYRAKMRQQYALKKSPCTDCCVHFWCECCALCQEYRELKINGFNMKIGWHGNVERRSRGILMSQMAPSSAPTVETGMTR